MWSFWKITKMDVQIAEKVHTLQVKCSEVLTYCNRMYFVCSGYARSGKYQFSWIFLQLKFRCRKESASFFKWSALNFWLTATKIWCLYLMSVKSRTVVWGQSAVLGRDTAILYSTLSFKWSDLIYWKDVILLISFVGKYTYGYGLEFSGPCLQWRPRRLVAFQINSPITI